jgi:hypothetical protein
MENQEFSTPKSPDVAEESYGAIYPETETPDEVIARRTETSKSWEAERRDRWEAVIKARRDQL